VVNCGVLSAHELGILTRALRPLLRPRSATKRQLASGHWAARGHINGNATIGGQGLGIRTGDSLSRPPGLSADGH